jgi:hypothetical protein
VSNHISVFFFHHCFAEVFVQPPPANLLHSEIAWPMKEPSPNRMSFPHPPLYQLRLPSLSCGLV